MMSLIDPDLQSRCVYCGKAIYHATGISWARWVTKDLQDLGGHVCLHRPLEGGGYDWHVPEGLPGHPVPVSGARPRPRRFFLLKGGGR